MDHLTLMGHGFGATTAINMASKDTRVKKVVTFDPWLIPLKEEIMKNKTISVPQPHCSVNSEIF
jgi:pimeloyl-ACP methyl ester carboxylesterase